MNTYPEEISFNFSNNTNVPLQLKICSQKLYIDWGDGSDSSSQHYVYHIFEHQYNTEENFNIHIYGEGIEILDVSHLNLSTLILRHCHSLELLNCSVNELSSLHLEECPLLEELCCNSNNLSELDLSNNAHIIQLNASYNLLKNINLKQCNALQDLYCSHNQLTWLELPAIKLKMIDVSQNQLGKEELEYIFKSISTGDTPGLVSCFNNPGRESSIPVSSDSCRRENSLADSSSKGYLKTS